MNELFPIEGYQCIYHAEDYLRKTARFGTT